MRLVCHIHHAWMQHENSNSYRLLGLLLYLLNLHKFMLKLPDG